MTQNEIVTKLAEWARAVLPELNAAYEQPVTGKESELPDVVVDMAGTRLSYGSSDFPKRDIQQALVMAYRTEFSFMVDNSDQVVAAQQLRDFSDRLLDSVLADDTLGGRVPMTSPFVDFDFSAPFVEYEDGTRGREMTMVLTVGGLVQEEQ